MTVSSLRFMARDVNNGQVLLCFADQEAGDSFEVLMSPNLALALAEELQFVAENCTSATTQTTTPAQLERATASAVRSATLLKCVSDINAVGGAT